MPIYKVTTKIEGAKKRLISSPNRAAALAFAARSTIDVDMATQTDIVHLVLAGTVVEDGTKDPNTLSLPTL